LATERVERRLAAILAADVAGYSRLMGADEEGTHERLKAHLRELVDPKIEERRGRIVKNTGDGLLAEFPSVVDAVRCAAEIQHGMIDRNADIPKDKRITFRIGVNLGDVIVEPEDIFGNGVNIAARLEELAEPGGICISGMVGDQIRDKLPYRFQDKGEQYLKNIARPVRAYSMSAAAVASTPPIPAPIQSVADTKELTERGIPTAPRLSIVVLPFGELPEFDSLGAVNELLAVLVMGLWNRLTRHQERSAPFRLVRAEIPETKEGLVRVALVRREELDGFVEGVFGKGTKPRTSRASPSRPRHAVRASCDIRRPLRTRW
jgi:class 3 adenylate cyclase